MILLTSSIPTFLLQLILLKENIKYSYKRFSDYLNNQCKNSIFIQLTDIEEIADIISTLNMNKSSGPNSIRCKILNLDCHNYRPISLV